MSTQTPAPDQHDSESNTTELVDLETMSAEEQLAFWKNDAEKWKSLSRKHEKLWRGGSTADDEDGPSAEAALLKKQMIQTMTQTKFSPLDEVKLGSLLAVTDTGRFFDGFTFNEGAFTAWADAVGGAAAPLPAPELDPKQAPKFNLGDIMQRDSHKQKVAGAGGRGEAYERTRSKCQPKTKHPNA